LIENCAGLKGSQTGLGFWKSRPRRLAATCMATLDHAVDEREGLEGRDWRRKV